MVKVILIVVFLSDAVSACHLDPTIFITPLNLEGLSGSCLYIPCNFDVKTGHSFPGRKNAVAVWIKNKSQFKDNPENVIFNSSKKTDKNYPMEITGDLSQKNCSTVFHNLKTQYTERYFFRIEDGDFRSTASCQSINITVQDVPWKPSIQISDESVTVTCWALTPCPQSPPKLTWSLKQEPHSVTERNTDGTFTTKIQETLTHSYDEYNLTCTASYPVKGDKKPKIAESTITLTYTHSGNTGSFVTWGSALGGIILITLIALVVYILRFKSRPNSPQTLVQPSDELVLQGPAQTEDSIHYEDVRFNQRRPKEISTQEETVYAQVKVSQPQMDSSITQATEITDIYAQVNK